MTLGFTAFLTSSRSLTRLDYFTPIVDDPYTFGAIAATNSLSDVYSMGGVPKTALNITCWPKADLDLSILGDIVQGGTEKGY